MQLPSKYLQDAVDQLASLPGIGRRTALRLALHLLKQPREEVTEFGEAIIKMRQNIGFCRECNNISDKELCEICANPNRDETTVCVVEDMRDVIAIESTHQFRGIYHVLGGIISPMDGIGPAELNLESLVQKAEAGKIKEVILALPTTMEGDTTNFYLFKRMKDLPMEITTIARGMAIGDELEYTDEITLGRSILNRTPFEATLVR